MLARACERASGLVGFDFPFGYPAGLPAGLGLEGTPGAPCGTSSRLFARQRKNKNTASMSARRSPPRLKRQRAISVLGGLSCSGLPTVSRPASSPGHNAARTVKRNETPANRRVMSGRSSPCWNSPIPASVASKSLTASGGAGIARRSARADPRGIWPFETGLGLPAVRRSSRRGLAVVVA